MPTQLVATMFPPWRYRNASGTSGTYRIWPRPKGTPSNSSSEAPHRRLSKRRRTLKTKRSLRILDFGCGTGWLGASLTSFGEVTGIDLSAAAIQHGQKEFLNLRLMAGDFTDARLAGLFDVISSDVIAHVADQQAYIKRVADLLCPDGTFLLMTQNGFVWRRSSQLMPQGEGRIRNWPTLKALRTILVSSYSHHRSLTTGLSRVPFAARKLTCSHWSQPCQCSFTPVRRVRGTWVDGSGECFSRGWDELGYAGRISPVCSRGPVARLRHAHCGDGPTALSGKHVQD
jgi:SAM-dependent methyltransferase